MIKVCKFGGTSLSSAATFRLVEKIISEDTTRKVIVVSAPGKRFCGDVKVTDILIAATKSVDKKYFIKKAVARFQSIASGLGINLDVEKYFDLDTYSDEYLISRGEYVNAKILATYLGFDFCDAFNLLYFKNSSRPYKSKSEKAFKSLSLRKGVVIPGFYYNRNGKIELFCRGGSDITGAYAAKYLKAAIYENFSDISGIASANPNLIKSPKFIEDLSYKEFENLDALNPTVFEKSAYKPVIGTKTDIIIKNTFNPRDRGTRISKKIGYRKKLYISIADYKNKIVVTGRNINVKDFLRLAENVLTKQNGLRFFATLKSSDRIELLTRNEICAETAVKILYYELFN